MHKAIPIIAGVSGLMHGGSLEPKSYGLDHFLRNETTEEIAAPPLELDIYKDSLFIYDTATGAVDARKNTHRREILYDNEVFKVKMFQDSLYWVGDSLTWVWVREESE